MGGKYTREIREELIRLGIMPKMRGFIFIVDAIEMAIDDKAVIFKGITGIYNEIAEKYGTKWTNVERCMRYATEKIEYSALEERFAYVIDSEKIRTMDLVFLIAGEFQ